jgi:hypothetical protein
LRVHVERIVITSVRVQWHVVFLLLLKVESALILVRGRGFILETPVTTFVVFLMLEYFLLSVGFVSVRTARKWKLLYLSSDIIFDIKFVI